MVHFFCMDLHKLYGPQTGFKRPHLHPGRRNMDQFLIISLQRMFGPRGNPRAENLFGVIAQLQQQEGINIELRMRSH
jgi:hypothetical protein